MRHIRAIAIAGISAASVAMSAVPAAAAVQTFTVAMGPSIVSFGDPFTPGGGVAFSPNLQLFDSSLGTLNSVTLSGVMTALMTGYVQNDALTPGILSASLEAGSVTLTSTDVTLFSYLGFFGNGYYGIADAFDVSPGLVAPGEQHLVSLPYLGASGPVNYTDAGFLAALTGVGTVGLEGVVLATTFFGNTAGSASDVLVTQASLTETVTYNYSPPTGTPEPMSMALLGTGLLGLGAAARRKRGG
jgi:hypothetical protein